MSYFASRSITSAWSDRHKYDQIQYGISLYFINKYKTFYHSENVDYSTHSRMKIPYANFM